MNFLQLVQRVAKESGTIEGVNPSSVIGQTGRLSKMVTWTADAWTDIQARRPDWSWLLGEFEDAAITAGTYRYAALDWGLDRVKRWVPTDMESERGNFTMYRTSAGVSDESEIRFVPYGDWRRRYRVGAQTANRPIEWSVAPDGAIVLGPTPDDAYTLRGVYEKTPQILAANTDVPDMPSEHHMLIVWWALVYAADHDEAVVQDPSWRAQRRAMLYALERACLPTMKTGGSGPLA